MLQNSHGPDGKIADELASTHDCTTAADTPVNYRLYVQQRTLKTSDRPDGKYDALGSTLACTTANDASVNYRMYVLQSPEISHRPIGTLLTCLARLSLAQL